MNQRNMITQQIGTVLDDISRLTNALYAMDTTDIQRYPDNYEVLSPTPRSGQRKLPVTFGI